MTTFRQGFGDKVPAYHELFNPILVALRSLGGSASISEITEQVIDDLKLSQAVVEVPHPGKGNITELEYRLAWARTYLKKYGVINNSARGVWNTVPENSNIKHVDPKEVQTFVRAENQRTKETFVEKPDSNTLLPDPDLEEDLRSWKDDLQQVLLNMPPDSFERLCQRLLRESGFIQVEVTGRSNDGGIDGHGVIRLAGLISFPVIFQCKRYQGSVSSKTVRDFRGAMVGRADKGLIITTGRFTSEATREATRDGAPPIDLIDGDLLMSRLKDLELGVSTKQVELIQVEEEWFSSI